MVNQWIQHRKIRKLGESINTTSNRLEYCINLYFKLEDDVFVWSSDGDRIIQRLSLPPMLNTIRIIHPQVINSKSTRETIRRELSGWNISTDALKRLIKLVIVKTSDMLKSMSPGNNVLDVSVDVRVGHEYFAEISDGSSGGMVPATESSIELLERKTLVHSESCSICFEEIREAVCMPCSHAFHGQCIERWLKTSHYCPMCRYKMPTD